MVYGTFNIPSVSPIVNDTFAHVLNVFNVRYYLIENMILFFANESIK